MPRIVNSLEWFAATEEPVDLPLRIREVQRPDPFVVARCHELAGNQSTSPGWMPPMFKPLV